MKIVIDREKCVSCGTCWDSCPGFFEPGPDSISQVLAQYRLDGKSTEGKPPEDLVDCAMQAVSACPAEAIAAEDE